MAWALTQSMQARCRVEKGFLWITEDTGVLGALGWDLGTETEWILLMIPHYSPVSPKFNPSDEIEAFFYTFSSFCPYSSPPVPGTPPSGLGLPTGPPCALAAEPHADPLWGTRRNSTEVDGSIFSENHAVLVLRVLWLRIFPQICSSPVYPRPVTTFRW